MEMENDITPVKRRVVEESVVVRRRNSRGDIDIGKV